MGPAPIPVGHLVLLLNKAQGIYIHLLRSQILNLAVESWVYTAVRCVCGPPTFFVEVGTDRNLRIKDNSMQCPLVSQVKQH